MKNMDGELDDTSLSQCHEQESNATQGNESLIFFLPATSPVTALPRSLAAWGRKILLSNRKILHQKRQRKVLRP